MSVVANPKESQKTDLGPRGGAAGGVSCPAKVPVRQWEDGAVVRYTIGGAEEWLASVYAACDWAHRDSGRITGALQVSKDATFVQVDGNVGYAPTLPCSRCGHGFALELVAVVAETYLLEGAPMLPREVDLTAADLDEHYLGADLEVAALVNEALQLAVPLQPKCTACTGGATGAVYTAAPADAHPFAALAAWQGSDTNSDSAAKGPRAIKPGPRR